MEIKELNDRQQRKKRQSKAARLNIVSEYYKKGYSLRQIAEKVKEINHLAKAPSPNTIRSDLATLTEEWLEHRLTDRDELVQLELERIDACLVELWQAWEKSKQDFTQEKAEQKHTLMGGVKGTQEAKDTNEKPILTESKQQKNEVRKYGDVAYIAEIRQQLMERRKLLGLYKPELKEITGRDGAPLTTSQQTNINIDELTEQELETLYKIAQKRDKKESV